MEDKPKYDKHPRLSLIYSDVMDLYIKDESKREEITRLFVEMANTLGLKIHVHDPRDFFLVMDENGKFVRSFHGFVEAGKFVDQNPGYKYFNRTHPRCPKELNDQFDEISGWNA